MATDDDAGRTAALTATTLVFDVLGTVLDEDRTQTATIRAVLGPGVDAAALQRDWSGRFDAAMTAITRSGRPYRTPAALHRETLAEVLTAHRLTLEPADFDWLAGFGDRLDPFPDTVAGLDRLGARRALVALTNAGSAQAFAMSAHAGLRWTTLLSSQAVQTFKPDPRVYAYAVEQLGLDPGRTLFVAAHPWDLDAAARHGLRTAYIDRGGRPAATLDEHARRFDLVARDLIELAGLLDAG